MNRYAAMVLLLLWVNSSCAQLARWSLAEAEAACKKKPKPFVIYMHTTWCKYCGLLDNTTFKNKEVSQLLNGNFYFIPFDAEQKASVSFNNSVFSYVRTGKGAGVHQLSAALAADPARPAFPTVVILDPSYNILYRTEQYISPESLKKVLIQIAAAK